MNGNASHGTFGNLSPLINGTLGFALTLVLFKPVNQDSHPVVPQLNAAIMQSSRE